MEHVGHGLSFVGIRFKAVHPSFLASSIAVRHDQLGVRELRGFERDTGGREISGAGLS
jgi:hypothetical protein